MPDDAGQGGTGTCLCHGHPGNAPTAGWCSSPATPSALPAADVPMSLRSRLLAAVLTAAAIPAVASAQTQLTYDVSQPSSYNNGSYFVGPDAGTLVTTLPAQSTAITMFCVDILNYVSGGDTWTVNVTSLADGTDPSKLRHPGLLTQYREAAWLASQGFSGPQGAVWTSTQYAMWGLLNPGSAPADPSGNAASLITLADYAASQSFGAFTFNSVSYDAFDYSTWSVLTDVRAAGVADDNFEQEFITGTRLPTTATPEPATLALVAGGLLLTAGAARRRRRA